MSCDDGSSRKRFSKSSTWKTMDSGETSILTHIDHCDATSRCQCTPLSPARLGKSLSETRLFIRYPIGVLGAMSSNSAPSPYRLTDCGGEKSINGITCQLSSAMICKRSGSGSPTSTITQLQTISCTFPGSNSKMPNAICHTPSFQLLHVLVRLLTLSHRGYQQSRNCVPPDGRLLSLMQMVITTKLTALQDPSLRF